MYQTYFEHEGKQYPTGTGVKIISHYPYTDHRYFEKAFFTYYDVENDRVWYQMYYTGRRFGVPMELFLKRFGGVTGDFDAGQHPPEIKQLKDSQIPKLFIGWAWYIVIMAFLTITTVRLGGWAITSILFFNWRKKVIEEEGYYVER